LVLSFHFHTFVPFSVFHICPVRHPFTLLFVPFRFTFPTSRFSSIHISHVFFQLHISPTFYLCLLSTLLSFDLSYYYHFDFVPFPFTLPSVPFPFPFPVCSVSFHFPQLSRFISLSPFVPFPFTLPILSRFLSLSPFVSFPFTLTASACVNAYCNIASET
jgi:hypothetical protein